MALNREHEIHDRRRGRNVGVGIMLGAFVLLIMALTYAKITQSGMQLPDMGGSTASQTGASE